MRALIDAISMTIGRDLLGRDRVHGGRKRVWGLNLEDDRAELERRIEAICQCFDVDDDLHGLFVDSGRDRPLIVARDSQYGLMIDTVDVTSFEVEMQLRRIDALIVDPLVEAHEVRESDNDSIKRVMSCFRDLAHRTRGAIDLIHHVRKNNGAEAAIDDVRGGGAIVGAARSVRLISPMSKEESQSLGIDAKDRRRYVSVAPHSKANFAPPIDARDWFHLQSIALGNGTADYPDGDRIGVPVPWRPPGPLEDLTLEDCREIRALAGAQNDPATSARVHPQASGWFGKLIAARFDLDHTAAEGRGKVVRMLGALVRERWLVEAVAKDSGRKKRPVYLPHPDSSER